MFEHGFPPYWSTLKKLIWLVGSGIAGGAKWITLTGSIVSFVAKKVASILGLTVTITPQQDLHGQDAPYPAGGGGNKLKEEWEIGGISSSDGSNVSQSNTLRSKEYSKVVSGETYHLSIPSSTTAYLFWYSSDNASSYLQSSGSYVAAIDVTVPSGANYIRLQMNASYGTTYNHNIALNYPSSITSYSPYSNICPITGWTGAKVTRTGKNLFANNTSELEEITYTVDGTQSTRCGYVIDLPAGTYTISAQFIDTPVSSYVYGGVFKRNGYTRVQSANLVTETTITNRTVTLNSDELLLYYDGSPDPVSVVAQIFNRFNIQIEKGSTATDYEPYQGTTLTVSFPDTVYGGEYEFVGGVGDNKYYSAIISNVAPRILDSPTYMGENSTHFYFSLSVAYAAGLLDALSNVAVRGATNAQDTNFDNHFGQDGNVLVHFQFANSVLGINSTDDLSTRQAKIKNWTAANPIQLVYKKAEPTSFSETGQPISTLQGQNNIWSDSGDVTLQIPSNIIVEGT